MRTKRIALAVLNIVLVMALAVTGVMAAVAPQSLKAAGASASAGATGESPSAGAAVIEAWARDHHGLRSGEDIARAITVDALGNVYVTGTTMGPIGPDHYATLKYDSNGSELWAATDSGPSGVDGYANLIALDNSGNVYVTGSGGTVKYDADGNRLWVGGGVPAVALALDDVGNVYVTGTIENYESPYWRSYYATVKYDTDGNQLWEARCGSPTGHSYFRAAGMALDDTGNVYVTGNSGTVKYDSDGNQLWAAAYGAASIALDGVGNVYVNGNSGTAKYDQNGNQLWVGGYDAWATTVDSAGNVYLVSRNTGDYGTTKYDTDGNQLWVSSYDGPGNGEPRAIAVDGAGNVVVTGYTGVYHDGGDSLPNADTFSYDYATVKYDPNGNEIWVALCEGVDPTFPAMPDNSPYDQYYLYDKSVALTVDSSGEAYVAYTVLSGGTDLDYRTTRYDSSGNELWATKFNGVSQGTAHASAMATDSLGNSYVTGTSDTTEWNRSDDYETVKYDADGNELWAARYDGLMSGEDSATGIAVDSSGNVYVTGTSNGSTGPDYATVSYDADGNELWVARYDGPMSGEDSATGIAVDSSGDVYVTGTSYGSARWKYMASGTTSPLYSVWGGDPSNALLVGAGGIMSHFDGISWSGQSNATAQNLYCVWGRGWGGEGLAVGEDGTIFTGYFDYSSAAGSWYPTSSGTTRTLCGVWGTPSHWSNRDSAFVVGDNGTILHYDGSTWGPMDSGTSNSLRGIWGTSSSNQYGYDIFAAGDNGTILHYDGSTWSPVDSGTSNSLRGIWGSSSSDIFAVGDNGTILHYDGGTWSLMDSGTADSLWGVSGISATDVFAVGDNGTVLRYSCDTDYATVKYDADGNQLWVARYDGPTSGNDTATGIAVDSSGNVCVAGTSNGSTGQDYATVSYDLNGNQLWVARYDGPGSGNDSAAGIAVDASGNVYVTGTSRGLTWRSVDSGTTESLRGVWGIYAVGDDGTIVQYNGSTWGPMDSGTTESLRGIWGGADFYYDLRAVGDAGTVVLPTEKLLWDEDEGYYFGWGFDSFNCGTTNALYGVWNASYSDVFAVGDNGTIWHCEPSGAWGLMDGGTTESLRGVWGSSPSDVFAVGDNGTVLHYDGSTWGLMDSGAAESLRGVWGSSPSDVFAVGDNGTVLHYDGSTWGSMDTGTTESLHGIWGSSSSDVFAVGDNGTVLHYDGSTWGSMDTGTTESLHGIWGSSSSDVFAVGDAGTMLHYTWNTGIATAKYDSVGNQFWVARCGGPGSVNDSASGLAVDGSGNVYVTGTTYGGNGADYITAKYDTFGEPLWTACSGGGETGVASAIALDAAGDAYVTGCSGGGYLTTKYDSNHGTELWMARYGTPDYYDRSFTASDIAADGQGNVYVTGSRSRHNNGRMPGSYREYATVKYVQPGLVSHTPSGMIRGPVDSIVFQFSNAMNTRSFAVPEDITVLSEPSGILEVTGYHWLDPHTLEVTFERVAGICHMTIGPNILDCFGKAMDIDGDLISGEIPDDQYQATFEITAPSITGHTPSGQTTALVDALELNFDRDMDQSSFSLANDIVRFTGPEGPILATGYSWLDSRTLEVVFDPQPVAGAFEAVVGPGIMDVAGNATNHDGDHVCGEIPDDCYVATFTQVGLYGASSTESNLLEDVLAERFVLSDATVTGDLGGTIDFTSFEIVSISSGAFSGKGFSTGDWAATLDGISYGGGWRGVAYLVPDEGKIHLKGAVIGEESGIIEGYLTESVAGSGIYDQYHATWKLAGLGSAVTSAYLTVDGILSHVESSEYPSTEIHALQAVTAGTTLGDYTESISAVQTHLGIASQDNPYYGQGFSMITYVASLGQGEAWTYDSEVSPGKVAMKGLLTGPLLGVATGVSEVYPGTATTKGMLASALPGVNSGGLEEAGGMRTISLSTARVDFGRPPEADIKVSISGPKDWVSPGQTFTYLLEIRNEGTASAGHIRIRVDLSPWLEFDSASPEWKYDAPTHSVQMKEIFWIPPKQKLGPFSIKVTVKPGLAQGTAIESKASAKPRNIFYCGINWSGSDPGSEAYRDEIANGLNADLIPAYKETNALTGALHTYYASIGEATDKNRIGYGEWGEYYDGYYKIGFAHSGGTQTLYQKIRDGSVRVEYAVFASPALLSQEQLVALVNDHLVKKVFVIQSDRDILYQTKIRLQGANIPEGVPPTATVEACDLDSFLLWWLEFLLIGTPIDIQDDLALEGLLSFLLPSDETFWIGTASADRTQQALFEPVDGKVYVKTEQISGGNAIYVHGELGNQMAWRYFSGGLTFGGSVPGMDPDNYPTAQHSCTIATACDPNIKYGPEGNVTPGQKLDYRVEYENVGQGSAFGVYFTDVLDHDLDASTLDIEPVISTIDGSVIAPPGTYDAASRTITWLVGEVGPGEGGYADLSVNVRSDAPNGTEIINFATVYFPSVPEATRTNGVVSTVGLNQPPVAVAGDPYQADEGSLITFDASGSSDPDGDALQYRWDFNNDGIWDTEWSNSPTASYEWNDDYQGTVAVEVSDGQFTAVATATVTVLNIAPVVEAGPDKSALVFSVVSFSGSFTDPGLLDTHTITWDFGDGSTANGTLTPTHAYSLVGRYTTTLTVTDDDGAARTDTLVIEIGQKYAIWANSSNAKAIQWSGSGATLAGGVHSNGGISMSGSNNAIDGTVYYVSTFSITGSSDRCTESLRVSPRPMPVHYELSAYRPGGTAAQAAGKYQCINGNFSVSKSGTVLDGLYYVKGNVSLSASNIRGTFTIVAEGTIGISGSGMSCTAYSGDLLFFSNGTSLSISGGNSSLGGMVYAPNGQITISGSNNAIVGSLFGDRVSISGSNTRITVR